MENRHSRDQGQADFMNVPSKKSHGKGMGCFVEKFESGNTKINGEKTTTVSWELATPRIS
jgi:hypothetical protein